MRDARTVRLFSNDEADDGRKALEDSRPRADLPHKAHLDDQDGESLLATIWTLE